MARYYFHLTEDQRTLADEEGLTLPDAAAARAAAIYQIRSIVAQETRETGRIWLARHIDVADDCGAVIEHVRFVDALDIRPDPQLA